jgi:hypothetical protein
MRQITIEEQRKILDVLHHEAFWSGMMKMDAICYGGPIEKLGEAERYIHRVIEAFPKDVLESYNKELKKAQADKLRAQADELEKS